MGDSENLRRLAELMELPEFVGIPYQAYMAAFIRPDKPQINRADKIFDSDEFKQMQEQVRQEREELDKLEDELSDDFADRELFKLIKQRKDSRAKIAAIKEYNRMRQRIIRREEISLKAEMIKPVYKVTVNGRLKKSDE